MPIFQFLRRLPAVPRNVARIPDLGCAGVFLTIHAFDEHFITRMLFFIMSFQVAKRFVVLVTNGTFEHQLTPLVGYGLVFIQEFDLDHSMNHVTM